MSFWAELGRRNVLRVGARHNNYVKTAGVLAR
jgi:hypothetical protein